MKKNKKQRRSDTIRKFHKGALKLSIIDKAYSYQGATVGKRINNRFCTNQYGWYFIETSCFRSLGYRINNFIPSLNREKHKWRKFLKPNKFPRGITYSIGE